MLREGEAAMPEENPSLKPPDATSSAEDVSKLEPAQPATHRLKFDTPPDPEIVALTSRQIEQSITERIGWADGAMVRAFARHHAWLMDADSVEWSMPSSPVVCHDHA